MQKSLWAVSISTFPEAEDATCELLQEYFNEPSSTYTDVETGISTATTYLAKKPDWTRALSARTDCFNAKPVLVQGVG